ncbi:MAG: cupredoxin domain-containing protein [Nitrososphaeraceae archaeon]
MSFSILTIVFSPINIVFAKIDVSPLHKIDQHIASYAVTIIPGASLKNSPIHYFPSNIAIPEDTTVLWYNNHPGEFHTVVSGILGDPDVGEKFNSDVIPYGSYFKYTFMLEGDYPYFCELHPWRTGFVSVGNSKEIGNNFELVSFNGTTLNIKNDTRNLLIFDPINVDIPKNEALVYNLTLSSMDNEILFHDSYIVIGNKFYVDFSNSDFPLRTYGPDFLHPITGAYHIEGNIFEQNKKFLVKVELVQIGNKILDEPISDEFEIKFVT